MRGGAVQFRILRPKRPPYVPEVMREVRKEIDRIRDQIQADYVKTTNFWEHKPKFYTRTEVTQRGVAIVVGTDDEIYGYVDRGTRPHIIAPRAGRFLRFPTVYHPHTFPGVIASVRAWVGGAIAWARIVHHPGTKARGFTEMIEQKYRQNFSRAIYNAIRRGMYRAARV